MPLIPICPGCGAGLCQSHNDGCEIERSFENARQQVPWHPTTGSPERTLWAGEVESSLAPPARSTTEKDVAASVALHRDRKLRIVPKQCWNNAARVLTRHPDYEDATYVEGLVVNSAGVVIEHGWLERDGRVIDPTLPEKPFHYVAGLRIAGAAGLREAIDCFPTDDEAEAFPLFYRFGWVGMRHPGVWAAWQSAMALSEGLRGVKA